MIDTLVIVVYNRFDYLQRWFNILQQCDRPRNVVVIHNYDKPVDNYRKLCEANNATYLFRNNIGYDIGAFQDVCKDRLKGFPAWDQLLWVTDDTFPMCKDFARYFDLQQGEGVRCMEISPYVREHIRTTGFSIAKSTAKLLSFPADPVITKQHCYLFEHRGGAKTFLPQVKAMGKQVKMVAPRETSPLFDTGYGRRQPRDKELFEKWNIITNSPITKPSTVTVICPVFNSFPEIISSMICQTYKDWELLLIHDGPNETGLRELISAIGDERIRYIETEKRAGNWGHSLRAEYLQKAKGEYVLITNSDNHHVPVYLEYMIKGFTSNTVATYCSEMVHSYKAWQTIPCQLKRGYLDCAGVLLRTEYAKQVGWNNITDHSADWLFFQDLINRYGSNRFVKVRGNLLIHN